MDRNEQENIEQVSTRPVIKGGERAIVLAGAALVDITQITLNIFAIGVAANRFISIVAGIILSMYGIMRKLMNKQQAVLLVTTIIAEQVPGADTIPFWFLNTFSLIRDPNKKGGLLDKTVDFVGSMRGGQKGRTPLNVGGFRKPTGR